MHICPQCNYEFENEYENICPKCSFSFDETLSCPYKISEKCVFTEADCLIKGLNFEDCKIYLKEAGINT